MAESLEQKKRSLITQLEMVGTLNMNEKLISNIKNKTVKEQVIALFPQFL